MKKGGFVNTYFRPELHPSEPEWRRAVHVFSNGEIYVTATILGLLAEEDVLAVAKTEPGSKILVFRDHFYVTFDWLIQHCPAHRDALEKLHLHMKEDPSLHDERRPGQFFSLN
jgi:hypothetical protein